LIGLYLFYYYTAKWQNTDSARATNNFVAKGLAWSIPRVIKNKQILERLGLIKDIVRRNEKTGLITGHYVKVSFYWVAPEKTSNLYPQCSPGYSVDEEHTNASEALILNPSEVINRNACIPEAGKRIGYEEQEVKDSTGKPNPVSTLAEPLPEGRQVSPVKDKGDIWQTGNSSLAENPDKYWNNIVLGMWKDKFGGTPEGWTLKYIKPLIAEHGLEKVKKALEVYFDKEEPQYIGFKSFASKFNFWKDGGIKKKMPRPDYI
jgi:hypothetical protein